MKKIKKQSSTDGNDDFAGTTKQERAVTQDANKNMNQLTEIEAAKSPREAEKQPRSQQIQAGWGAPTETAQLLHELLVRQIELEIQSEEYQRGLQAEAEAGLATGLARYTDLYDFAPVGYFTLARNSTIVQANQTGASQLGRELTQLPGTRFSLFVAEADLPAFTACLERIFTTSTKQTCELTLVQQGQPSLVVQFEAMLSANEQECRAMTMDISARKQAVNTLESSLEQVKLIQNAIDAHSLVAITDRRGKTISANDKFCAVSRYSHKELLGQDHRILNSGFHPKEFFQDLWTTIAQKGIWKGEIKNRAKDGSFFWLDTTIVPFIDTAGRPYQYVAISTEVTQRKHLEQLMEQQIKELARSNAELGQFAYVATHDLQEPLRAVASCVQLLKKRLEGQLDARTEEYIAHAVDGTVRMQMLIDDLLTYSQINADQTLVPVDCTALLDNVLKNLTLAIVESGAVIIREPLPTVGGIPSQLTQIFQNLISNALKFRGEHPPEICIDAAFKAGEWVFSVADNGIGMESQYSERIFRMFQRLHTRTEYPGTGIGLAVCKKVAECHGGRIWVESQPEQGSTFYFTIAEKR